MDIFQLGLYIAAIVLVMWSQSKVQGAYKHFSTVRTENHLTGAAVARVRRTGAVSFRQALGLAPGG